MSSTDDTKIETSGMDDLVRLIEAFLDAASDADDLWAHVARVSPGTTDDELWAAYEAVCEGYLRYLAWRERLWSDVPVETYPVEDMTEQQRLADDLDVLGERLLFHMLDAPHAGVRYAAAASAALLVADRLRTARDPAVRRADLAAARSILDRCTDRRRAQADR